MFVYVYLRIVANMREDMLITVLLSTGVVLWLVGRCSKICPVSFDVLPYVNFWLLHMLTGSVGSSLLTVIP